MSRKGKCTCNFLPSGGMDPDPKCPEHGDYVRRRKKLPRKAKPAGGPAKPIEFNSLFDTWRFNGDWAIMAHDVASTCTTMKDVAWVAYQSGFNAGAKAQLAELKGKKG